MRRVGLYLGFPPQGGGAFQYAQSVLDAVAALPADRYEVVAAHSHPAWAAIVEQHASRIRSFLVREGRFEPAIRFALRQGFPLALWRRLAPAIHRLTRDLLRQNCDLWIFPAQDALTYAIPARTIGTIHDLMHRYERRFPEVSGWGLYRRRERHYRNLCARASAVLVDSRVGKQQAIEAYAIENARVHVLPYVAPGYIRKARTPADFDVRYDLPAKFVFYPAQFWEHKNHVRLLQALAIARESVADLHLVLAGSRKNAYEKVLQAIDSLKLGDAVHILGYIPDADMFTFYQRARALVMPTFFGPTNIPPLEAMAAGCPIAVSRIYAMPEQVGDAALLFDPASVAEIAEAMLRLATDDGLRAQLSAAGKRRAQEWGQAQFDACFGEIIESVFSST